MSSRTNYGRHKGSTEDCHAWVVACLLAVEQPNEAVADLARKAGKEPLPRRLLLQRFYRPEDISRDVAYRWVAYGCICRGGSLIKQ